VHIQQVKHPVSLEQGVYWSLARLVTRKTASTKAITTAA
jgi:hypothetical protein